MRSKVARCREITSPGGLWLRDIDGDNSTSLATSSVDANEPERLLSLGARHPVSYAAWTFGVAVWPTIEFNIDRPGAPPSSLMHGPPPSRRQ